MSTLADRLNDLADERAPRDLPDDDLWTRGRRRHRRRRTASAVLALVLVVGAVGFGSQVIPTSPREAAPAAAEDRLPLLDRLQEPSRWTSGTDDDGPIGPLVAVDDALRGRLWGGNQERPVGVSASGEYRFLDLPEYAGSFALSSDGALLAFGYGSRSDGGSVMAGFAVYDTVTGEVRRHRVDTPVGVGIDGMVWAGHALYVDYATYEQDGTSFQGTVQATVVWDLDDPDGSAPAPVPSGDTLRVDGAQPSGDRALVVSGRQVRVLDADRTVTRSPRLPVAAEYGTAVLSPDGTRIAWVEDGSPTSIDERSQPLLVADLADPTGTVRRLGRTAYDLVGWRDDGHVVTAQSVEHPGWWQSVDVDDGSATDLVQITAPRIGRGVQVAADALQGPVVAAPDQGRVLDPRLPLGLAAGLVVVLLVVALLLLRRRRARLR